MGAYDILAYDPTATFKSYEMGSASGLARIARQKIGQSLSTGDFEGAAAAAFGAGDNAAGSQLAQIAQQKMTLAKAQADKEALSGALNGVLPENLRALAGVNPNVAVDMYGAQQNNQFKQQNFAADEAYRQKQLSLDERRLAQSALKGNTEQRANDALAVGLQPGTPEYQSYVLTGKIAPRTKAKTGLTATELKFQRESQNNVNTLEQTISNLDDALSKTDSTFEGLGASAMATIGTKVPGGDYFVDPKKAQATAEYTSIMSPEAIQTMAATLKGATTDFELRKFESILSDPSQPNSIKKQVIGRMKMLAEKQLMLEHQRLKEFSPGAEQPLSGTPAPNENAGANIYDDISQFQEGDIFADENGNTFTIMNGQQVPVNP